MSRRADFYTALACRQPAGAVPLWELEFHAWDAASGQHVVLGEELARLSPAQQELTLHRNAEIMLGVCAEFQYAALTVPGGYWYQAPGELAYYILPGEMRYRQAEILRRMAGPELVLVAGAGGVLTADYSEAFCEKLFERPEEVDAQAQQTLAHGLANAQRWRAVGIDAVFTASDIADNSGQFFNPAQMRRFILPYLTQWAEACRTMGLATIFHSDGNLTRCLDDLANTGVQALQALDPIAGMDMATSKATVAGRLCLCGNIDCGLLLRGTPEAVYESTRQLLDTCKAGGGLILGASNAVQPTVPMPNYRALRQAWHKFGQY